MKKKIAFSAFVVVNKAYHREDRDDMRLLMEIYGQER